MATVIVRRHGVYISQQTMPDDSIDRFLDGLQAEPDKDGLAATILHGDGTATRLPILKPAHRW